MKLAEFVSSQQDSWAELDALIVAAQRKPGARLGSAGVRRLGALYRSASGDLAIARRQYGGDPVVARLERTVTAARGLVYGTDRGVRTVARFFRRDMWRCVLERPLCLIAALVLLAGPTVLSGVWSWKHPQLGAQFVPSQYRSVAEPNRDQGRDRSTPDAGMSSALASQIMTNNIRVTFLAFAGGLLFGLLTIFVLIQNGLLLGVLSGLAIGAGNSHSFFELILPHGVLELSCIVVSGAAGFRIACAIIAPGHRKRSEALREEAVGAVRMVLMAALWLVVAGTVEGFITPQRIGFGPALLLGLALGALFWGLIFALGRRERPAKSVMNAETAAAAQILAESFSFK